MSSETFHQKQVIDFLNTHGFHVWHARNGATYDPVKKVRRKNNSKSGLPDICGHTLQQGVAVYIEMKIETEYKYICKHYWELLNRSYEPWSDKKERYHNQIKFIQEAALCGSLAGFAHDIETAKIVINGRWLQLTEGFKG